MTSRHKRAHLLKTGISVVFIWSFMLDRRDLYRVPADDSESDARPPFNEEQAFTNAESPSTRYCLARAFSPYNAH